MRLWAIWPSTVRSNPSFTSLSQLTSLLADNKLLIVKLGGLEPLIRQMLSPNVEVQCNAVGCVTNLATHGPCKSSHLPSLWLNFFS